MKIDSIVNQLIDMVNRIKKERNRNIVEIYVKTALRFLKDIENEDEKNMCKAIIDNALKNEGKWTNVR